MDVRIGVSQPRKDALQKAGQVVPPDAIIRALVDTGASCTCVDPDILKQLQLTPKGKAPTHTPSTGGVAVEQDVYDVSLSLIHPHSLSLTLRVLPVLSAHLSVQGIHALIGRDILDRCLLVYDGDTGIFTLAF